jgi:hypothetical protein
MVIKKKIAGEYYTMTSGNIFPGSYDRDNTPSLIPKGEWIGLKSEVVTLPSGHVLINLYTDVGRTGTWTLGLSVQDDGSSFGGSVIGDAGHSGIRTDFLDVSFSDYSITEHDPIDLTPSDELPKGYLTFIFDGSNSTVDNTQAISDGITFRLEGIDTLYSNREKVELNEGTYVVIPEYSGATFVFGEDCNSGKINISNKDDKTCTVLEEIVESDSGDEDSDVDVNVDVDAGGSVGSVGTTHGLCDARNTSCSPAVMKAEGLNDAQANAMSCIAVTESGGDPLVGGSGTGAQGLFQITGTNWSNPAYHSGSCSVQTSRNNATCNRQTAVLMFKSVGYQPWTGKCMSAGGCGKVSYGQYWNPNAVACVQKYDPGARI